MLNKRQLTIFTVFTAIIGGCATIGLVVLVMTVVALIQGAVEPSWVPKAIFGLFVLGTAGSIIILYSAAKKFRNEVFKKIGLGK